jgi:hypothetical protein
VVVDGAADVFAAEDVVELFVDDEEKSIGLPSLSCDDLLGESNEETIVNIVKEHKIRK